MPLSRILNSFRYRRRWQEIGVPFFRSGNRQLTKLMIGGKTVQLHFPESERAEHEHELTLIFFDDCYRLREVTSRPKTILDIGGNIGLFSMIARHHFPEATIHCYEPNPMLRDSLNSHIGSLDIVFHPCAVGGAAGFIGLSDGKNSLHSVAHVVAENEGNSVPLVAFQDTVNLLGGSVDFVKLDCEGGEWEILETVDSLENVRQIAMEFHLWAKPGSERSHIESLLKRQGFEIVATAQRPNTDFGLLFAERQD